MDTKKAIEFLEFEKNEYFPDRSLAKHIYKEREEKFDEIVDLLQRGEKYRQIVEEIKYELNWHKPEELLFIAKLEVSKDEEYLNEILDMIDNIEQKYFPKENIKEVIEGITEQIKEGAEITKKEAKTNET